MRTRIGAVAVAAILATGLAIPVTAAQASTRTGIDHTSQASAAKLADLATRQDRTSRFAASATGSATTATTFGRLAGANRYDTAVQISKAAWPSTGALPDAIFLASGLKFPDALAGGPLATQLGPLLLVPATGTVPQVVLDEAARLGPQGIAVLGGTSSVSDTVVGAVASAAGVPGSNVLRLSGTDRYMTAAIIAETTAQVWATNSGVTSDTVMVANGKTFADALGGGVGAAYKQGSLLLNPATGLNAYTSQALSDIGPSHVFVLGGTSSIGDDVVSAIQALLPTATVQRLSGPNRFATAAAISVATTPTPPANVIVANGLKFPDALAAGPAAPYFGAAMLLSKATCAPAPTVTEFNRLTPAYAWAVGGTSSVSNDALMMTATC